MAYCQSSDVQRYITTAVGADVAGAIAAAQEQVNLYTGDLFESATLTVYGEGNRLNVVDLPYTTQSITSVASSLDGNVLSEDAWSFENGKPARVRIYPNAAWSILIAGSEPYNVSARPAIARVNITGVFGSASVPAPVKEATAILAANFLASTGQGTLTPGAETNLGAPNDVSSITVEGYSVTYRDNAGDASKIIESTGLTSVDRMLAPYRRTKRSRIF